jgi:hypothetical protein
MDVNPYESPESATADECRSRDVDESPSRLPHFVWHFFGIVSTAALVVPASDIFQALERSLNISVWRILLEAIVSLIGFAATVRYCRWYVTDRVRSKRQMRE